MKNIGCRIESEELEGVGLRVNNGGCTFKREERRVGVKGDIRKLFKGTFFLLVNEGRLQNFSNPSGRKVKLTPKYP